VDDAGDVIVGGQLPDADPGNPTDFAVIKLSGRNGSVVWAWSGLGPGSALAVTVDQQLNVIAAGYLGEEETLEDFVVVKLNGSNGSMEWKRHDFGDPAAETHLDRARSVAVDPYEDIVVAGSITNSSEDFAVIKLDGRNGQSMWERHVDGDFLTGDRAYSVIVGDDVVADVIAAGVVNNGPTGDDYTVVKFAGPLHPNPGEVLWRTEIDLANGPDRANSLALDKDGNVLTAGFLTRRGKRKFAVAKMAGDGELLWKELVGNGEGLAITADESANVFAVGSLEKPPGSDDKHALFKFSGRGFPGLKRGEVIWEEVLGILEPRPKPLDPLEGPSVTVHNGKVIAAGIVTEEDGNLDFVVDAGPPFERHTVALGLAGPNPASAILDKDGHFICSTDVVVTKYRGQDWKDIRWCGSSNACDPNLAMPLGCEASCEAPVPGGNCGDGVTDSECGEECDNDNTNTSGDGCSATCIVEYCGDGVINNNVEECDDGAAICSAPGQPSDGLECSTEIGADECEADGGTCGAGNSDVRPDACRTDCKPHSCGDGVEDAGEECDDGRILPTRGQPSPCDGCSEICTVEQGWICGDGILNPRCGEECDHGAANSNTRPDSCRTYCRWARCGDRVKDTGENCDDGPKSSQECGDYCSDDCTTPYVGSKCGDAERSDHPDCPEDCDFGPDSDPCIAGCSPETCTFEFGWICGDGLTSTRCGEQCDEGVYNNDFTSDTCRPYDPMEVTRKCVNPYCGDGICDAGTGEDCDDGNRIDGDGCTDCSARWEPELLFATRIHADSTRRPDLLAKARPGEILNVPVKEGAGDPTKHGAVLQVDRLVTIDLPASGWKYRGRDKSKGYRHPRGGESSCYVLLGRGRTTRLVVRCKEVGGIPERPETLTLRMGNNDVVYCMSLCPEQRNCRAPTSCLGGTASCDP
jgi:cysteine-rich repeat protein